MNFNTQQNFMAGLSTRFLKRVPPQLLSSGVFYAYWLAVDRAVAQPANVTQVRQLTCRMETHLRRLSRGQALFISANLPQRWHDLQGGLCNGISTSPFCFLLRVFSRQLVRLTNYFRGPAN